MSLTEKYDKLMTGLLTGLVFPFVIALIAFLISKGNPGLKAWLTRIAEADIITHVITLCVFPNVLLFLLFNRLDMLRASRGVLGITIIWAIIVFSIKIFG